MQVKTPRVAGLLIIIVSLSGEVWRAWLLALGTFVLKLPSPEQGKLLHVLRRVVDLPYIIPLHDTSWA
jgi:hypothetical protein